MLKSASPHLNIFLEYFTGGQILNQFVRWAKNWILSSGSYVQTAKYIFPKLKQYVCHSFLYYSPRLRTEHGRVMFELIGRWKVWGRVKILISESSPPLVQTEKGEGSDDDLEKVFPLFHRRGIILFIRSQKLLSFRRIHKSSDCWQVSWIKYGGLNILILLHVNSSWYKYFLELWIWIWKWNLGNVFCENSTCYIISSCTEIYWDFPLALSTVECNMNVTKTI